MKKKLLILYASYGTGHKKIAEYIAKYFKAQDNDLEICTLDILTYSMRKVGKWSQKTNSFLMLKMPIIHDLFYRFFNHKGLVNLGTNGSLVIFKNKRMANKIGSFSPDVSIATHFFGSSLISYYNQKEIINSRLITVVTDYEAHEFWIKDANYDDYIVVGNKDEEKQLIKRGIEKEKIKVFGIPIAPNEDINFDRDRLLFECGLSGKKPICIFFGGGGNGSTASIPYAKKVFKATPNIDYIYIAGKNQKSFDIIVNFIKENHLDNVKVKGYVDNVPELLKIASFVISKPGGVQSTECLYYNVPILMIKSSGGQEIANYKYFSENGYGKYFRFPWTLTKFVKNIENNPYILNDFRKNMEKNHNNEAMPKIYDLTKSLLEDDK